MDCPECGLEIAACPRCGASLEGGVRAPGGLAPAPPAVGGVPDASLVEPTVGETVWEPGEELELDTVEEAAVARKAPRSWALNTPWAIVSGALALLLVSTIAIVLAVALIPWESGDTPEDTVNQYFQAFEEDRQADVFDMYDPADLEELAAMYGMSLEDFKNYLKEDSGASQAEAVAFEDLAYAITTEECATVQITAGAAVVTDAEGQTSSEDVSGMEIELVKKDGRWYLKMPSQSGGQL